MHDAVGHHNAALFREEGRPFARLSFGVEEEDESVCLCARVFHVYQPFVKVVAYAVVALFERLVPKYFEKLFF